MGSLFGSLLESAGLGKGSTGGAAVEAQGVAKEGAAAAPGDAPATPAAATGTGDAAKQGGAAAPAHPHTGPTTTAGAAAAAGGQQHGQAHASASLSSLPSLSVKPVSSTPGHAQQAYPHLPPQPPAQPPAKPMKQAEVNYAAEKAGAVVLGASEALVGAKHLLDDDRDKYARSPCDQDKWVVINLSEDVSGKWSVQASIRGGRG